MAHQLLILIFCQMYHLWYFQQWRRNYYSFQCLSLQILSYKKCDFPACSIFMPCLLTLRLLGHCIRCSSMLNQYKHLSLVLFCVQAYLYLLPPTYIHSKFLGCWAGFLASFAIITCTLLQELRALIPLLPWVFTFQHWCFSACQWHWMIGCCHLYFEHW